jgi:hypothetical protein
MAAKRRYVFLPEDGGIIARLDEVKPDDYRNGEELVKGEWQKLDVADIVFKGRFITDSQAKAILKRKGVTE